MLKIEAGKKYRTRGGDEVEVLRTGLNSSDPIAGIVTCKNTGDQSITSFKEDGSYFKGEIHCLDLISEIKPKRVVWLNLYPLFGYDSRSEADASADPTRIACIRVEFEEGQFDE